MYNPADYSSGLEFFQSPEFIALCDRFGINRDLPIRSFSFSADAPDETMHMMVTYFLVDKRKKESRERLWLQNPVSTLKLNKRGYRCLAQLKITTIEALLTYTAAQLLACKGCGLTTVNEIREKLDAFGLKLRGD